MSPDRLTSLRTWRPCSTPGFGTADADGGCEPPLLSGYRSLARFGDAEETWGREVTLA